MKIKFLVINKYDGNIEDITYWMYWFEENYVQDLNNHDPSYWFEIYVDDKLVFTTKELSQNVRTN